MDKDKYFGWSCLCANISQRQVVAKSTLSLTFSSLSMLKEVVNPIEGSLHKFSKELDVLGDGYFDEEEEKLVKSIVVKYAYLLHHIALVFIGDLMFKCRKSEMCRKYFRKVSTMDALGVTKVRLHFI